MLALWDSSSTLLGDYQVEKKYDEALNTYARALVCDPNDANVHFRYSLCINEHAHDCVHAVQLHFYGTLHHDSMHTIFGKE